MEKSVRYYCGMDGEQFKALLERAKMPIRELAKLVPVKETTLYAYSRGFRSIPRSFRVTLASAFRVHAAVLVAIAEELERED